MIAALFVEKDGTYSGINDVEVWDQTYDARRYAGPHPVVAHPPCERWGRYWSGGPSAKVRRIKGDDDGCFESALRSVRKWGGVLEHPEASHAWAAFGLVRPDKTGWTRRHLVGPYFEWTTQVEQGHYGHRARKKTWLLVVSPTIPPELEWGPSTAGFRPIKRLSRAENLATPSAFRALLITIAQWSAQ